jgi:hypothetical protein
MTGNIRVQPLQFLTELRDILIGCTLGRGELGFECCLLRRLPLLDGMPPVERRPTNDKCHDNQ